MTRESDLAAREDAARRNASKAKRELQDADAAAGDALRRLEAAAADERALRERLEASQSELYALQAEVESLERQKTAAAREYRELKAGASKAIAAGDQQVNLLRSQVADLESQVRGINDPCFCA